MFLLLLAAFGVTRLTESVSLVNPNDTLQKLLPEKECSVILSPDPKALQSPNLRLGQKQTWCIRRSEEELEQQLKEVGGFNRRYLAITKTQALQFKNMIRVDASVNAKANANAKARDETMESELKAKGMIGKASWKDPLRNSRHKGDTRVKRAVPAAPGTAVRQCVNGGSLVSGSTSVVHMCTECTATTRLDADKFPTFINEVVCHSPNFFCAKNVGMCRQKVIFQTILRRTGQFAKDEALSQLHGMTIYKEIWAEHTQEIRSCCECQVFLWKYQTF